EAAQRRPIVEFGTRRAHTPQAGALGARAAYIGGCAGTSNVEAGRRFGIPVFGTAAHSWTLAYNSESEAFARLHDLLGDRAVYLVDTYDVEQGVRNAVGVGRPFWGIRLDSGDFLAESRLARRILDGAGFPQARIMASGDLNEYRIAALVSGGAPIDWFGVGTELATSCDAPSMGSIYKLVQIGARPTAKFSREKPSLPGAKQVFRLPDHDVIGLAGESIPNATPVLAPVIQDGRRLTPPPGLAQTRARAHQNLAALPAPYRRLEETTPYPVLHSEKLRILTEQLRHSCLLTPDP
ncbi:MAG: nicotinate phosphoribosyltransferase, partial [Acidobacteria bacterium]|nr:nicotinate phosphoribosyltransferase [Acidobacteriota bacterium]